MNSTPELADAPIPEDIGASITDEDIARCRRQIGVARFSHNLPYNSETTFDAIRHFAFSVGDDNPLYLDRSHGRQSRWQSVIAPPMFYVTTGIGLAERPDADQKALFKGLFKGVSKYYTGVHWTFWGPLAPGDRVYDDHAISEVIVRNNSRFSGKRTVTEVYRHLYLNSSGVPMAMREESFLNAERGGSRKQAQHSALERQIYSADDLARIEANYAAEKRRGNMPRFWDDVTIEDQMVPVTKGPLSMVDVIGHHMGQGLSHYGIGPLRLNHLQRKRMPGFFSNDKFGVPQPSQRVHWDEDRARDLGLPAPHDYGQMRANWLAHLVTNWMGDDGWLWKLSLETRRFNFMGDTSICGGRVVAKRVEDGHHVVELALETVNQRNEHTAPGTAVVILPTRNTPVSLPRPPKSIERRGADAVISGKSVIDQW